MIENTNETELNKLYNKLIPSINKLYNNYFYLELTKEQFENIVKKFLSEIYSKKDNQKQPKDFYITKIKQHLKVYVKNTIKNEEHTTRIINNFINKRLFINEDTQENINELRKLSNFLEKYDFIPSLDTCIELIENNQILSSILKQIIENKIKLIQKEGIESIDKSTIITILLDVWCTINNITYEKADENIENLSEDYDLSSMDSLKAYLSSIPKNLLTLEEERELINKIKYGDESAKNKLIEHNLKLVVSIAKRYIGRGLSLLDLIQEGNLGLMKAADRYDVNKGYKFSTYATYWIRQAITKSIGDKSRSIRIPIHIYEKLNKYRQIENILGEELNRTPTLEEISKRMNISEKELSQLISYSRDTVSINTLIGDEEDSELENFIPSYENNPEEEYYKVDLSDSIKKVFQSCDLDTRQIQVLLLRNGFYGKIFTLEEIGKRLCITRERVRQIESKALRIIRESKEAKVLINYTNNPKENLALIEECNQQPKKSKKRPSKKDKKIIQTLFPNQQPQQDDSKINSYKKEEESKMTKRKLTIYEYFEEKGYTKEQVKAIIPSLTSTQLEAVKARNGEDLDNPVYQVGVKPTQLQTYYRVLKIILNKLEGKGEITVTDQENAETQTFKNNQVISVDENSKVQKREKTNKLTIYEYFARKGYSKEQVQEFIPTLTSKQLEVVKLRNGNNLENPVYTTIWNNKATYYKILKIILEKLEEKYGKKTIVENKPEDPTLSKMDNIDENSQTILETEEKNMPITNSSTQTNPKLEEGITKEEYLKILELIKTPTFSELMSQLDIKSAVIISLRLGYIDNKYFSTESIAKFLEITEEEVRETTIQILNLYKNNLNSFIDKAIAYTDTNNQGTNNHTKKLTSN